MISLSKSLAAMSGLFSTLTLSVVVFAQTAFAQTATEQAPSALPAEPAAPVAPVDSAAPVAPADSVAPPATQPDVVPPSDVIPPSGVLPDAASSTAMPDIAQQAGSIPASMLPHDLTPWGMFMQADIVVKAVMVGLAFASLVTWTVWLAKSIEIRF